jgi:WD40 repeat protein
MRFVAASGRVVSKSTDGLVQVWLPERPDEPLLSVRVRGAVAHATRFDLSEDGRFLACGNSRGQVFIFDLLHSGRQIARLEHPRSRAPVTACAFSHDLRSVLMCASEPYIWRWDFIAPEKASSSSSSSKRSHE